MKSSLLIMAGIGCVFVAAVPSRAVPLNWDRETRQARRLVEGLTQADVQWNFGTLGITAHLESDRARQLVRIGMPAVPELIKALADETRYASAHAILTQISEVEFQSIPYNGMFVSCSADNELLLRPEDRFRLARRWQRWHAADPKPRTLPE
jgi:hypothetical protein